MPYQNLIKKRLREIGKNQEWLAKQSEIRRDYLSKIINGHYKPNVYDALNLAASLDTTVEDLFGSPQSLQEEETES